MSGIAPAPVERAHRSLLAALAATVAIRLVLGGITPMTGDEAYFILWGRYPDYGFYDHPPLVGWILALLLKAGDAEIWLRLPAMLHTAVIAWLIYALFSAIDREKAAWAATAFALAPVNALNVLITTDTPLILFCFLSAITLYLALRDEKTLYYALSGLCLGLAFLSKYFAALLAIAYAAYFLFTEKTVRKLRGLALLAVFALPFVALNLYWNYQHCWANWMFNLYNRNKGEAFGAQKILTYVLMMVYVITPPVLYYFYRARRQWLTGMRASNTVLFGFTVAVPLGLFLLLSTFKVVGLHWVLAFLPFLFILAITLLSAQQLRCCVQFMAWFTAVHLIAIAAFAAVPLDSWKSNRQYDALVFLFRMPDLLKALQPYEKDYHFATEGYTAASILTYHYHGKRLVSVFGQGKHHARQDDILTDYRKLDRQNIAILLNKAPDLSKYSPYFDGVETRTADIHGHTFHTVLGHGFKFPAFRDSVLRRAKDKYYRIPAYLPLGACEFCSRYFPNEPCR